MNTGNIWEKIFNIVDPMGIYIGSNVAEAYCSLNQKVFGFIYKNNKIKTVILSNYDVNMLCKIFYERERVSVKYGRNKKMFEFVIIDGVFVHMREEFGFTVIRASVEKARLIAWAEKFFDFEKNPKLVAEIAINASLSPHYN